MSVSATVRQSVGESFFNPIVGLNILLITLSVLGLAYYIVGSNSIAASEYRATSLRNQSAQLLQQQSNLMAEKTSAEDPTAAAAYAQQTGMVSAQDIVYVFENGNVALQR